MLRRSYPDPGRLNVVDFGCGTGGLLHLVRKRIGFQRFLGVDASAQAIALARRLGPDYAVVDPETYAPETDTDLVLLMDVIEHVADDVGLLARLLAPLATGAALLISVPAVPMLYTDWDRALGHHRRYTRASLSKAVRRAGAEVAFLSYGFSYLLPIGLVRRASRPAYEGECVFPPVPRWAERSLLLLNRIELAACRVLPIPFGTSLFCLARRT